MNAQLKTVGISALVLSALISMSNFGYTMLTTSPPTPTTTNVITQPEPNIATVIQVLDVQQEEVADEAIILSDTEEEQPRDRPERERRNKGRSKTGR